MTNGEMLGKKLYELRKREGFSQEELAERLCVSRQAVSKWECGESLPDTDNLIEISRLYGVSLDELVGNVPKKQSCTTEADDTGDDTDENSPGATRSDKKIVRILYSLPYTILVVLAFLVWGFIGGDWDVAWTLFVTIPVYESLVECVRSKRMAAFAYPVFLTFIYLLAGMLWGIWHPLWVIYITIPIYYAIADAVDRK